MEELKQILKEHEIFNRWKSLEKHWKSDLSEIDAILILDGEEDDEVIKIKTLAFQTWLYKFEFSESITIISSDTLIFYSKSKKIDLLQFLENHPQRKNKKIVLIDNKEGIDKLVLEIKNAKFKKFGYFSKES